MTIPTGGCNTVWSMTYTGPGQFERTGQTSSAGTASYRYSGLGQGYQQDSVTASTGTHFVRDPYGNLVAMRVGDPTSSYYLTDNTGSVRNLVSTVNNATASVANCTYCPTGNLSEGVGTYYLAYCLTEQVARSLTARPSPYRGASKMRRASEGLRYPVSPRTTQPVRGAAGDQALRESYPVHPGCRRLGLHHLSLGRAQPRGGEDGARYPPGVPNGPASTGFAGGQHLLIRDLERRLHWCVV